jgi:alpha-galactosidase
MKMKTHLLMGVLGLLWMGSPASAASLTPSAEEMAQSHAWAAAKFEGVADANSAVAGKHHYDPSPFFSFTYDGKPSSELLKTWGCKRQSRQLDAQRTEYTVTYADPQTGLEIRCVATEYLDYPASEWVVFVANKGTKDTPILEGFQALDDSWAMPPSQTLVVHHGKGSTVNYSDFAPITTPLDANGQLTIGTHAHPNNRSGSSSVESLPFFNLASDHKGVIVGLGWTGPWTAECTRDANGTLRVQAGMERMHLLLHPGEEIRSPRVVSLFWHGDRLRAQNLWRRFVLAHHSPQPAGKPFAGLIADANWGSWMNAETHIAEMNFWADHDLPMECYWVDAGWTDMSLGWEAHQSSQVPNPALFPQGMRPLADAAHRRNMKFLLWMVPQSVHPKVGIGKEHPEWLGKSLSGKEYGDMVFYGLDHGDPAVTQHMIEHFSKVVSDFGVDVFRQDGGNLWPENNTPDRLGMVQIRYIEGLYDFWDGLLKQHPGLLIDNCAEGGKKIDLETISRSIVLWRSDIQASGDFDSISNQTFNYGLLPWTPLCGAAAPMKNLNAYSFRSAYCPAMLMCWPMTNIANIQDRWSGIDVNLLRKLLKEYVSIRPYLFGDFYPLTPFSMDADCWMAWQFHRPEQNDGLIQVFRRAKCPSESVRVKLHELVPDATYSLTNLDTPGITEASGRELMEKGLSVAIQEQPGSAVITYQKKP